MKNLIRFDWAMKRLLRNKANFVILEGLLSELLGEDIKIQNFLESESNKETAYNKKNQVDMLVKNSKGELIIIEVQGNPEYDYLMRMVFGTSKLMVDNTDIGMEYRKIKKIISLNIVYFDLGHGKDYIYHGCTSFKGMHEKDVLGLTEKEKTALNAKNIEQVYPEYYIIKVNNFNDISKNTLDEWINFLKNEEIKDDTKAKGLKEAKEKLDIMKLSPDELKEYEKDLRSWYDNRNAWNDRLEEGKMEGKIEGKMEIAKKCIENGLNIEMTAKLTGLSEDEIKNIQL